MPHTHRFFIEETPARGLDQAILTGAEAHHALHVVRLRVGDEIEVFDGNGHKWDATVIESTRHNVHIHLREYVEIGSPPVRLTLFQAWLHRDKAIEEVVRHGTEIGIAQFVFFPSHHSERVPRTNDKWRRIAIEACKQCRRAWLPSFAVADSLDGALAQAAGTLLVATRELPPAPFPVAIASSEEISLFVGPEGDFTDQELAAFIAREAKAVSLGAATYRSEVAAVLTSALVLYELGQLGPIVRTQV